MVSTRFPEELTGQRQRAREGWRGEHVRHSLLGVWPERCDATMRCPSEARNRELQGLELRGAPGPEREHGEGLHGFV